MTRPKDDLATRARSLYDLGYDALDLPDVPEPRRAVLETIRDFAFAVLDAHPSSHPPGTPATASLERQLAHLRAFVQEDRRVHQSHDGPRQNTRADGTGQPVIWTDPRLGAGTNS